MTGFTETRRLAIRIDSDTNAVVTFHISCQTHFGGDFSISGDMFCASNGVTLISSAAPCWDAEKSILYVGGNTRRLDDTIEASPADVNRIISAIDEYNSVNNQLPASFSYFYITELLQLKSVDYTKSEVDKDRSSVGNFFVNYEQAVCALNAVKVALNETRRNSK